MYSIGTPSQKHGHEDHSFSNSGPLGSSIDPSLNIKEEEMPWLNALNELNEETFKKANEEKEKKNKQEK